MIRCVGSFAKRHLIPIIQALTSKLKWRLSYYQYYHRLADAEAWVAFRADVIGESSEAYSILLTPLRGEVLENQIHPVNRGFNAIIEAAVHATRYIINRDPKLEWLIRHHLALAKKCGGEREKEAATLFDKILE